MEEEDDYEYDPLDEKDFDYDYDDTLIRDDKWEDLLAFRGIRDKYPVHYIMKVVGYSYKKFDEIKEWCEEACEGDWQEVGWSTGCSSTVAVAFTNPSDAVLYKLRFG